MAPRPVTVALAGVLALALAGCGAGPAEPAATPPSSAIAIPTAAPELRTAVPTPSGPRPDNGTVVKKRDEAGQGELAVENEADRDALVTLSRNNRAAYAIYVRTGETTELTGVADGDYRIFVALGDGWDDAVHQFTISPDYSRFADMAAFTTAKGPDGIRYTHLKITLAPTAGANAGSVPVDPEFYPT